MIMIICLILSNLRITIWNYDLICDICNEYLNPFLKEKLEAINQIEEEGEHMEVEEIDQMIKTKEAISTKQLWEVNLPEAEVNRGEEEDCNMQIMYLKVSPIQQDGQV